MTTSAVVLIILSVILTACVAFLGWLAQTVYNLHAEVAVVKAQQFVNVVAIKDLTDHGSPVIREVMVMIGGLRESQARIEKILEERIAGRIQELEDKVQEATSAAAIAAAAATAAAAASDKFMVNHTQPSHL